jgi:hypothetical protein
VTGDPMLFNNYRCALSDSDSHLYCLFYWIFIVLFFGHVEAEYVPQSLDELLSNPRWEICGFLGVAGTAGEPMSEFSSSGLLAAKSLAAFLKKYEVGSSPIVEYTYIYMYICIYIVECASRYIDVQTHTLTL